MCVCVCVCMCTRVCVRVAAAAVAIGHRLMIVSELEALRAVKAAHRQLLKPRNHGDMPLAHDNWPATR